MKDLIKPIYSKIEPILDKTVHRARQGIDAFSYIPKLLNKAYHNFIESILDKIYLILNKDTRIARLIRYLSFPLSALIPIMYKQFFSGTRGRALIFTPGVHMIRAKVGGGKSLASFVLAELYLEETGFGSYFTSPVEKPSVTDDGEWLYVFHRVINIDDYYKNGKKVMNFNTKKYKVIHKDERHLDYNPRLNNSKEYNNKFIPEQKDEILMRHEGIEYIYKYSQYMKLDSQDMDALTYMHDVETVKDIPVKRWLDTGALNYIPVSLKFTTYVVEISFDGRMTRRKVGKCKIQVPYELLERFDTHAEKYRNAGLPVDFN